MKRMTRRQACAWLGPIRAAMRQVRSGVVDSINGYPVTRLHDGDKWERLDWCVHGFVALIERLSSDIDTGPATRLATRLEAGVPMTVADVDLVLALLNRVEDYLVGLPIALVKEAVTVEQINIELEALGLKAA